MTILLLYFYMPDPRLEEWNQSRISWRRWEEIEAYYLDNIRFDEDDLPLLAPIHPAFEPGYQFSDWVHFVPNDAVSRLRSSEEFESEFTDIIREIFDNIEQDIDDGIRPIVAQGNDSYAEESTYEERRKAIEAFLCRVFTLQMRGDVNFEKIETVDTETLRKPSTEPPNRTISVTVERYSDLDRLDVIRFSISNPTEFFQTTFGDSTLMFERLLESDKEPENVKYSIESSTVSADWRIHTGI